MDRVLNWKCQTLKHMRQFVEAEIKSSADNNGHPLKEITKRELFNYYAAQFQKTSFLSTFRFTDQYIECDASTP